MQNLPPPSPQIRLAILNRFRVLYLLLTLLFAGLTIAVIAWHWKQPKDYANGFPYQWSVPILLVATLLINGISFYFQNRYTRTLLQRPHIATEFRPIAFAIRFYLYNFATAIILALLSFFPLLSLLFFYWIYPIASWLVPYHALTGMLFSWEIKRSLQPYTSGSAGEMRS